MTRVVSKQSREKSQDTLNILLADDDSDDRFFFKKALRTLAIPYEFNTVEDGEQLMSYLKEHAEMLPDILFLDLNMPRKNGSECLSEIKRDSRLKEVSVIIYSTSLHREIADELYKTGAHYYVKKCDYGDLVKIFEKLVALLLENPEQPSRDNFILTS